MAPRPENLPPPRLKILERCGHTGQAMSIARGLFPDAWSAGAVTPQLLMSTRRQPPS